METTQVAAALIWDGNRFLICRRPPGKTRANLWEFAGGKVESGETPEQALKRECFEELGVTVEVKDLFAQVFYSYPDMRIHLMLFTTVVSSGDVKCIEHSEMKWIKPSEIDHFNFCPADIGILEMIKKEHS